MTVIYSGIKFILFLEIIIYYVILIFQTQKKHVTACRWNFVQCYLYFHPSIIGNYLLVVLKMKFIHYKILYGLLILIWSSDCWAFVFGKSFGRHKLFERIITK